MGRLGKFFLLLLTTLIATTGCTTDIICKKPEAGELVDVKDGLAVDNLLFVLSSPQDVLNWCSPYISVFKIESNSLSFYKMIELPAKISSKMVLAKNTILTTLQDTNSIYLIPVSSIIQSSDDHMQIKLDIEDIYHISAYDDSFAISSLISRKTIFGDIDEIIKSKREKNLEWFNSSVRMPTIIKIGDKKYVIGLNEKQDAIHILPDREFSIINKDVTMFNQPISNITKNFQFTEPISFKTSEIFLFYPIFAYEDRIFIPSKITIENSRTVTGIISIHNECLLDETKNIPNCYFFLESPTGSSIEKLTYFKIFSYEKVIENSKVAESNNETIGIGKLTNEINRNESTEPKEKTNEKVNVWFFVFKEKNNEKEIAYIDIWIQTKGIFQFFARKEVENSPFYHISDVTLSDQISFWLIFYSKKIILETERVP